MKRFDLANEVAKQLITIASAIIAVVLAFYEKFFSHTGLAFGSVIAILLIFVCSIVFGVWSIGGLTNLIEAQERNEWRKTIDPSFSSQSDYFIGLNDSAAQKHAMVQQGLFALGLILFFGAAVLDRLCR